VKIKIEGEKVMSTVDRRGGNVGDGGDGRKFKRLKSGCKIGMVQPRV